MQTITFKITTTIIALSALCCLYGCEKETQNVEYRRLYPIPTELPEATCDGANTIGCHVDSILFVANYFPNTSSGGPQTYEGGVRAFIENPDDDYIQIIAEHPIRPDEIDNRWMRLDMRYFISSDSITSITFTYLGNGHDFALEYKKDNPTAPAIQDLDWDPKSNNLSGVISFVQLAEHNPQYIGDPKQIDMLILRDLRLDLPVYTGRD